MTPCYFELELCEFPTSCQETWTTQPSGGGCPRSGPNQQLNGRRGRSTTRISFVNVQSGSPSNDRFLDDYDKFRHDSTRADVLRAANPFLVRAVGPLINQWCALMSSMYPNIFNHPHPPYLIASR